MRKRLLAATALCGSLIFLLQGPAVAQDAHDWSGPYLGMALSGVGWDTSSAGFRDT